VTSSLIAKLEIDIPDDKIESIAFTIS
jgi:hypothetical protein